MTLKSFASLMLLLLALAPGLRAGCTNATISSRYGFTTIGTLFVPGPAPVSAAGSITFQLNGDVIGFQDRSVGGAYAHETIQGNYTITNDCAIKLTALVYDDSGHLVRTSVIDGIAVDNGKQIHAVFESVILPNNTPLGSALTVDATRVH